MQVRHTSTAGAVIRSLLMCGAVFAMASAPTAFAKPPVPNAGLSHAGIDRASVAVGDTFNASGTVRNLARTAAFTVRFDLLPDGSAQPASSSTCRTPDLANSASYTCTASFRAPATGNFRVRARVGTLSGGQVAGSSLYPSSRLSAALAVSAPTTEVTPPPAVSPTPVGGLPAKVVAGYWPYWPSAPIRIRDIPTAYNVIYLFHARPVGGAPGSTGAVYWTAPGDGRGAATNLVADIQYARSTQGRKVILSAGGAGNGMSFPNRTTSQAFVDSVAALYGTLGGFDGLDWNTYEADQQPDTLK